MIFGFINFNIIFQKFNFTYFYTFHVNRTYYIQTYFCVHTCSNRVGAHENRPHIVGISVIKCFVFLHVLFLEFPLYLYVIDDVQCAFVFIGFQTA